MLFKLCRLSGMSACSRVACGQCDISCFGLSALQFLLDSHDQLAQHPVPSRRTPPGPATPCSPGADAEHVHAAGPSLPNLTLHVRVVSRGQGGITEGLVKGALSVAASAYKALFTGPNCSVQVGSSALPHTGCLLLVWGVGGVFWAHPADPGPAPTSLWNVARWPRLIS